MYYRVATETVATRNAVQRRNAFVKSFPVARLLKAGPKRILYEWRSQPRRVAQSRSKFGVGVNKVYLQRTASSENRVWLRS
jgi:hypothetical protein